MKSTDKNFKPGWFIPLLITAYVIFLNCKTDGIRNIAFSKLLFVYTILYIYYNWLLLAFQKKMYLIEPFFLLAFSPILSVSMLPHTYDVWYAPAIFTTLGTTFLILSIGFHIQESQKRSGCAIQTVGTVLGNKRETVSRKEHPSALTYFPIIEYFAGGNRIQTEYPHGQPRPMAIGKTVEICYNPEKPDEICFSNKSQDQTSRFIVPIFLIIGILSNLAAIFIWLHLIK